MLGHTNEREPEHFPVLLNKIILKMEKPIFFMFPFIAWAVTEKLEGWENCKYLFAFVFSHPLDYPHTA